MEPCEDVSDSVSEGTGDGHDHGDGQTATIVGSRKNKEKEGNKEEFELEVEVGNVDIYDDFISGDTIAAAARAAEEKATASESSPIPKSTRTSQYPLSLRNQNVDEAKCPQRELNNGPPASQSMKFECLVGNLTWWTTDADVKGAIEALGVFDCVEIKFFENRVTGVSKGFCCCTFKTAGSLKLVTENLCHEELNGKRIQVMSSTKEAIVYFESQDILRVRCTPPSDEEKENVSGGPEIRFFYHENGPGPRFPQRHPVPGRNPRHFYPNQFGPFYMHPPMRFREPFPNYRGPGYGPMGMDPRMGHPGYYRPWFEPPPPRFINEGYFTEQEVPPFPPVQPGPESSPPHSGNFRPLAASSPVAHQPHPHVNREFLRRGHLPDIGAVPASQNAANRDKSEAEKTVTENLKLEEHESAMSKVKLVASSAMTRAMTDAADGQYSSSIETLVTAISLLRQSKVVDDSSVKILIASLQDRLETVESQKRSLTRESRRLSHSSSRHYETRRSSRSPQRSESRRSHRDRYSNERSSFSGDYSSRSHDHCDEYVPRMKIEYRRSRSPRRDDEYWSPNSKVSRNPHGGYHRQSHY